MKSLALIVFLLLPLGLSGRQKKIVYDEWVPVDYYISKSGETCFVVVADLNAGKFFKGLQRIETRNGPVFKKNNAQISRFPDSVILSVQINAIPCNSLIDSSAESQKPKNTVPKPFSEIAKSLVLEVWWKQSSGFRKATVLHEESSSSVWSESDTPTWVHTFTLDSTAIPFTENLLICARWPDGRLAVLSGGLTSPPENLLHGSEDDVQHRSCPSVTK